MAPAPDTKDGPGVRPTSVSRLKTGQVQASGENVETRKKSRRPVSVHRTGERITWSRGPDPWTISSQGSRGSEMKRDGPESHIPYLSTWRSDEEPTDPRSPSPVSRGPPARVRNPSPLRLETDKVSWCNGSSTSEPHQRDRDPKVWFDGRDYTGITRPAYMEPRRTWEREKVRRQGGPTTDRSRVTGEGEGGARRVRHRETSRVVVGPPPQRDSWCRRERKDVYGETGTLKTTKRRGWQPATDLEQLPDASKSTVSLPDPEKRASGVLQP